MITTIFTFIVFILGFLAAFIDWNKFLTDLVDIQIMRHKAYILFSIGLVLLGFYLIMYLPAQYMIIRSESKTLLSHIFRTLHLPSDRPGKGNRKH